ncbi:hypothetical protein BJV78DRAFT_1283898 [Lactifluus subvellereus]|nr:hypothetical protein BJV78DRAFT_1283898 [Lactifluus subvellereus]
MSSCRQQQPSPTPAPLLSRLPSFRYPSLSAIDSGLPRCPPDLMPTLSLRRDLLVTPSMSYSSSSSAFESASPPVSSKFFVEPYVRDKSALPSDLDTFQDTENEPSPLDIPIHPLR